DYRMNRNLSRTALPWPNGGPHFFSADARSVLVSPFVDVKTEALGLDCAHFVLIETHTGQVRRRFFGTSDTMHTFALSANGRILVAGHGSFLLFWDVASGKQIG